MFVKHYSTKEEAEKNCNASTHTVIAEGNAVVRYRVISINELNKIHGSARGGLNDFSQIRENHNNYLFDK